MQSIVTSSVKGRSHTLSCGGAFSETRMSVRSCFFGGEDLLFIVAALGVDFPRGRVRDGLENPRRHDKALKFQQGGVDPFIMAVLKIRFIWF